jgi:hypothetical protein
LTGRQITRFEVFHERAVNRYADVPRAAVVPAL